jgi:hypothetical protein
MSVTLLVKLNRSMPLNEIEAASAAAMRELLNLGQDPSVIARFDESGRMGSSSDGLLTDSSNGVVCSLLGHEEKVAVTPFTVPFQVPMSDDSSSFVNQNYVGVDWHSRKTPLCWALVAAVAAGLARKQESEIEDNAGFFTKANVQTPDEFCRILRLPTPQADVERAAVALYEKMPKSAEVTEWLKRRSPT